MDVLQVPVVVRDANAGRLRLLRQLGLEPAAEHVDGLPRAPHVRGQLGLLRRDRLLEGLELGALALLDLDPEEPQVARVFDEIGARLRQQRRDRLEARPQLGEPLGAERQRVLPQLDRAGLVRALARGRVGLRREHDRVEARVARPGPQHALVEVEPVHLGAHDPVVDLLRDRPAGDVDRSQPRLERRQRAPLLFHGGGRVIRHPVPERGPLELAPFLEQRHEVVVTARGARLRGERQQQRRKERPAAGSHRPR
jgi:hypothetical protein